MPGRDVATGGLSQGAQPVHGGVGFPDAFVARFTPNLQQRLQATYLGGTGSDSANAMVIHPVNGDVYITGFTRSQTTLPFRDPASGALTTGTQPWGGGTSDAFVAWLDASLVRAYQSTFFGGSSDDEVNAIGVHFATGDVYVAGITTSVDTPGRNTGSGGQSTGAQSALNASREGFVARINSTLSQLVQSTYLGGAQDDQLKSLLVHPQNGEIYVAGYSNSLDWPAVSVASGGVSSGAQSVRAFTYDAVVTRMTLDLAAGDLVPNALSFPGKFNVARSSVQTSFPAQITGVAGNVPVFVNGGNFAEFCLSSSAGCTCDVQAWGSAPATANNNQWACVRQVAPTFAPAQVKATLVVGGG